MSKALDLQIEGFSSPEEVEFRDSLQRRAQYAS
jgi:hypothetical protein